MGIPGLSIPATDWTLVVGIDNENFGSGGWPMFSLYIWRPSTSSVVGYIYDSHTALGRQLRDNRYGQDTQVIKVSGAAVEVQTGDVLVLEIWTHHVQSFAFNYTTSVRFDGTTDAWWNVLSDRASYLDTPIRRAKVAGGRNPWIGAPLARIN